MLMQLLREGAPAAEGRALHRALHHLVLTEMRSTGIAKERVLTNARSSVWSAYGDSSTGIA
eukprot:9493723-Pyramimonas_sp.AAC.2